MADASIWTGCTDLHDRTSELTSEKVDEHSERRNTVCTRQTIRFSYVYTPTFTNGALFIRCHFMMFFSSTLYLQMLLKPQTFTPSSHTCLELTYLVKCMHSNREHISSCTCHYLPSVHLYLKNLSNQPDQIIIIIIVVYFRFRNQMVPIKVDNKAKAAWCLLQNSESPMYAPWISMLG